MSPTSNAKPRPVGDPANPLRPAAGFLNVVLKVQRRSRTPPRLPPWHLGGEPAEIGQGLQKF